jgi:predicted  nucleic acid-binding Zn-ribbon protein
LYRGLRKMGSDIAHVQVQIMQLTEKLNDIEKRLSKIEQKVMDHSDDLRSIKRGVTAVKSKV